jgi:hypothetical protein
MKWKNKNKMRKFNSKREIRRFLLFPRCINGETRWLEFATICQSWIGIEGIGWMDYKWVD